MECTHWLSDPNKSQVAVKGSTHRDGRLVGKSLCVSSSTSLRLCTIVLYSALLIVPASLLEPHFLAGSARVLRQLQYELTLMYNSTAI
jgi:hypothetical protein